MALTEILDQNLLSLVQLALTGSLIILVGHWAFNQRSYTHLPTVNAYPFDWMHNRAKAAFESNAAGLIEEGQRRYPDRPFRIIALLGPRVILPTSWIQWLRNQRDLDHQAQVSQEFFGTYPGFEAIGAFAKDDQFLISVIKSQLGSINADMDGTIHKEAFDAIESRFGASHEWHDVDWDMTAAHVIARVSAAIFVGPPLCHDPEWIEFITTHTLSVFNAVRALRTWPASLRPVIHWVLPPCRLLRAQVAAARVRFGDALMQDEVEDNNSGTTHIWARRQAAKRGVPYDPIITQLALAAGAIHTTSQLMNQSLKDLALASETRPELIAKLRQEISETIESSKKGPTPAALARLRLLDACVKESQRLKPGVLVNLDRGALKDVVLPDGLVIPKDTLVTIPSNSMWSRDIWGDTAKVWDPMRFIDATKEERVGLSSSTDKAFAFGLGKFICPGRFLVTAELLTILSIILEKWDIRLAGDPVSDPKRKDWVGVNIYGFEMLADSSVKVEAKRRTP